MCHTPHRPAAVAQSSLCPQLLLPHPVAPAVPPTDTRAPYPSKRNTQTSTSMASPCKRVLRLIHIAPGAAARLFLCPQLLLPRPATPVVPPTAGSVLHTPAGPGLRTASDQRDHQPAKWYLQGRGGSLGAPRWITWRRVSFMSYTHQLGPTG